MAKTPLGKLKAAAIGMLELPRLEAQILVGFRALGALTGAVVGDQIQAGDQRSDAQDEELRRQRREIDDLRRQQSRDRDDDYERY